MYNIGMFRLNQCGAETGDQSVRGGLHTYTLTYCYSNCITFIMNLVALCTGLMLSNAAHAVSSENNYAMLDMDGYLHGGSFWSLRTSNMWVPTIPLKLILNIH